MRMSANFRTVFSESQNADPLDLDAELKTYFNAQMQNDHSKSFKVICFGVSEELLWEYTVQYNNCSLA